MITINVFSGLHPFSNSLHLSLHPSCLTNQEEQLICRTQKQMILLIWMSLRMNQKKTSSDQVEFICRNTKAKLLLFLEALFEQSQFNHSFSTLLPISRTVNKKHQKVFSFPNFPLIESKMHLDFLSWGLTSFTPTDKLINTQQITVEWL